MLSKSQFNVLTALGAVALVLVVVNSVLFTQNRATQLGLSQRQQFVQQTVPLEGLYREIVKSLADLAVKANDREVLNMLAAQGFTVTVNGPATSPADAAPRKGEK
jgi:hypothetical protein